jgi:chemotaxis signal transduction protein
MSALAKPLVELDEFALEMRTHFLNTTLESLDRFQSTPGGDGDFTSEIKEAVAGWISEARSNEMPFLAQLLEKAHETGKLPFRALHSYLAHLQKQPDGEGLFQRHQEQASAALVADVELYLQCLSGDHRFLVPVKSVIEIIIHKKTHPLPLSQSGVKGLISFRGQGIPVMDLHEHGFLLSEEQKRLKTFYVVGEHGGGFFALEVHQTEDVIEIDAGNLQKNSGAAFSSPVVEKFVIQENKTLMLLDIPKLVKS